MDSNAAVLAASAAAALAVGYASFRGTRGSAATMESIAIVDVAAFRAAAAGSAERQAICERVARSLHESGCLIIRDPRVTAEDNAAFVALMEQYYGQGDDAKRPDARPELHYQVGVTPEFVERPRNHCSRVAALASSEQPQTLCPPDYDSKWRFFWRVGPRPAETKFTELNAEPVKPKGFPRWQSQMDSWGAKLLDGAETVAEMAAIGFNLPPETFSERMNFGPHLLGPTGSDLRKFGKVGTVLAGYHYDLNFLTIHGKSSYPALSIWLRDGRKVLVKVPDGCLLLQAGKQFEWLTGGHVLSGFHEVTVLPATVAKIEQRLAEGKSHWRISSTLFNHIASDRSLRPVAPFDTKEALEKYPEILAGEQVQQELEAIMLAAK